MTEFLSYYIVIVTNYHNRLEINYWVISAFWILLYVLILCKLSQLHETLINHPQTHKVLLIHIPVWLIPMWIIMFFLLCHPLATS